MSNVLIPGECLAQVPLNILKETSTEVKRDIRSKGSRFMYMQSLCDIGDSLYNPLTDKDTLITVPKLIYR
jgi:hypothetical protein